MIKKFLKSELIYKAYGKSMKKSKILDDFCPFEVILVSEIIPFMFIAGKTKGAEQGLKGKSVLVLVDLKKIQTALHRNNYERAEHLTSLETKIN